MFKLSILSLLLGFTLSFGSDAALKLGYFNNFDIAATESILEEKPIMLVVVKHQCPWCEKLISKSLSDEAVAGSVVEYFIPVIMEQGDIGFPSRFRIDTVPSILFIDRDGHHTYSSVEGYLNPKELLRAVEDAI